MVFNQYHKFLNVQVGVVEKLFWIFILCIVAIIVGNIIDCSSEKSDSVKTISSKLAAIDSRTTSDPEYLEDFHLISSVMVEDSQVVFEYLKESKRLLELKNMNLTMKHILYDVSTIANAQTGKLSIQEIISLYTATLCKVMDREAVVTSMILYLSNESATKYGLKTETINGSVIGKMLPLLKKERTESGNGRVKTIWAIKPSNSDDQSFEVIGDNQNDADQIGWSFHQYDQDGMLVRFTDTASSYLFLVDVLSLYLKKPELLAKEFVSEIPMVKPRSATRKVGDFTISCDGEFFFIQRESRRGFM